MIWIDSIKRVFWPTEEEVEDAAAPVTPPTPLTSRALRQLLAYLEDTEKNLSRQIKTGSNTATGLVALLDRQRRLKVDIHRTRLQLSGREFIQA